MTRFIVTDREGYVRGDLTADTADLAVALMEGHLTDPGPTTGWLAYVAPAGFPAHDAGYLSRDPAVLAMTASVVPVTVAGRAASVATHAA